MDLFNSARSRFGIRRFISKRMLRAGTVAQFTYEGKQRYGMIVHPNWESKFHVLAVDDITERDLLDMFRLAENAPSSITIYEHFKSSRFYKERPYRTYLWNKITTLREVFIKPSSGTANAKTP